MQRARSNGRATETHRPWSVGECVGDDGVKIEIIVSTHDVAYA